LDSTSRQFLRQEDSRPALNALTSAEQWNMSVSLAGKSVQKTSVGTNDGVVVGSNVG
jgi:hypothetical protein